MCRRILLFLVAFVSIATVLKSQEADLHYVYFADGRVWGYPEDFVKDIVNDEQGCQITLVNDSVISWPAGEVDAVSRVAPAYPQLTAFKLDDKLNDQIFEDVEAMVTPDWVTASVSAIGKYLTPSFKLDRSDAVAYVNGEEQVSGQSRLHFADEVVYTLGAPNYRRLSVEKVSDEVWSEPERGVSEVSLTEEMLSTNAPTSFADESLGMMLDGEPSTLFHSTWSQDPVYDVDLSKQVYVSVALPYSLSEFQFYYMGRVGTTQYNVKEWVIEASNDGQQWDYITSFDESSGIPYDIAGGAFTSPTIALGASYSHLRFTATRVGYKNYLCLAEFKIYEVVGTGSEPELLQPARYDYRMVPMGREVVVDIDWLTDHAASVPRIDIDTEGGEIVTSKDYYLNAHIRIQGNGVWDDCDFEDSVQIKGRGNSSWSTPSYSYEPKNPYRLKFASSVKPFGMKKGKNWNLIAQKLTGSLLTNPVAQKVARMVGMETANDVVPVELYMNGEYRGSYFFTQKVGMANNSVDYDDESQAALFELDEYYETGQFRSGSYRLPVNIKDPEFGEDETQLDYEGTRAEFNRFEAAVYDGHNFERFVDMDMLVRYMLVNDLILNTELGHPKSAFLARENLNRFDSKYTFGPAWDFDWSYGYEGTSSYCTTGATRDFFSYHSGKPGNLFFQDLLRSSEWVKYHYYQLWTDFVDNHLQELIDYVDEYYAYARSSFENNAYQWGDGYSSSYEVYVANMKAWLVERAHYIKDSLTPYAPDAAVPYSYGDLNGDGAITSEDMEYMQSALLASPKEGYQPSQADVDADGAVSVNDLVWVSQLVGENEAKQAQSRIRTDEWMSDGEEEETFGFDVDDLKTLVGQESDAALSPATRAVSEPIYLTTLSQWNGDGLLDNPVYIGGDDKYQYHYTSPLIMSDVPVECLRFKVLETSSSDVDRSGYPCFALAEFYLYDANGASVALTADNFSTNAQEYSEGPMKNIVDGNTQTYFHSAWKDAINDYHYIDITLPEPMTAFSLGYVSRRYKVAPAVVDLFSVGVPEQGGDDQPSEPITSDVVTVAVDTDGSSEWNVSVSLENATPYIAYMMDFVLPAGFTVSEGSDMALSLRTESVGMTMQGRMIDASTYRIIGYSELNQPIVDTTGELFSFPLSVLSSQMPEGDFTLSVENVVFVTENALSRHLADANTTFVVSVQKQQVIPFEEFALMTYGDAPLTMPAVTDAGLTIAYTSSNPSVATMEGNVLTVVGAGSSDITATQEGDASVQAATPVTHTLVVEKARLTITADDITRERYAEVLPPYTLSYTGFVLGDTELDLDELPNIACEADATSPVGTYPIHLSGGNDNNYAYILVDGVLTIIDSTGVGTATAQRAFDVYDFHGCLVRKGATSLDGLEKGVYLVNGKKIVKY